MRQVDDISTDPENKEKAGERSNDEILQKEMWASAMFQKTDISCNNNKCISFQIVYNPWNKRGHPSIYSWPPISTLSASKRHNPNQIPRGDFIFLALLNKEASSRVSTTGIFPLHSSSTQLTLSEGELLVLSLALLGVQDWELMKKKKLNKTNFSHASLLVFVYV